MKFLALLFVLSSTAAYATPAAPTVKCSVVQTDSTVTPFSQWVFETESETGNTDYVATASVNGLSFKLSYNFANSGRLAAFVEAGTQHVLTTSFPILPKGQLSRVLFYAPFDADGKVLAAPAQFDIQCFN